MTDQLTATQQYRVLVAEDDPHDQMLLIMAAEDANASVKFEFVTNGEELVDELRGRQPEELPTILVLDMRMPRMSGHEVLDWLSREPSLRPPEVGMFSTSHRTQDVEQSLAKGAQWHEVKPSKFEDLVAFIERLDARCRELASTSES